MNTQLPEVNIPAPINPLGSGPPNSPSSLSDYWPSTGRKRNIFKIIIPVILFLIILSLSSVAVLAAYDKINLSNPSLQASISYFVQSIPFAPKTPKFILNKAIQTLKTVKKYSADFSMATQVENLPLPLNSTQLDLSVKGNFDYSDLTNPLMSMNLSLSKDLTADLRVKNKVTYFKINKIPSSITLFLGIDESKLQPIFSNWYYYDASPLETEARKQIESIKEKEKEPQLDKKLENTLLTIYEEDILPNLSQSEDKIDGFPTYKLHLLLEKDRLDKLVEKISRTLGNFPADTFRQVNPSKTSKPSDFIDNLTLDFWVDKTDYYIRQISIPLSIKMPDNKFPSVGLSTLDIKQKNFQIAIVLKLSDFNKPVVVEIPTDPQKIEELYKQVTQLMYSSTMLSAVDPLRQLDKAKFTASRNYLSELMNAIVRYYATKASFPISVADLLKEGELKSDFPNMMIENQIEFKVNPNASKIFIYSLIADPSHTDKPFLGVEMTKENSGDLKNYSKDEIDAISGGLVSLINVSPIQIISPTLGVKDTKSYVSPDKSWSLRYDPNIVTVDPTSAEFSGGSNSCGIGFRVNAVNDPNTVDLGTYIWDNSAYFGTFAKTTINNIPGYRTEKLAETPANNTKYVFYVLSAKNKIFTLSYWTSIKNPTESRCQKDEDYINSMFQTYQLL
ncbi:hypothetical protein HY029_05035 [Candidatus Gottesmanbacteria bacterium]|nr:hypothetical protein [Candidatus Gottesmanbacteria bacterium]